MKAQYFGDVNDYRKFALLRLLAQVGGFLIGVCWMLTEDDGSGDGAKRGFIMKPDEWRRYDLEVFDALKAVPEKRTLPDLQRVEAEGLIPGATYFEDLLSDKKDARAEWHNHCLTALGGVDLAFFDPDNGLEVASRPRGRKHSNKYAFVDELAEHYRAGRTILLYQHYPQHKPRAEVTANACERLEAAMPGAKTRTLATPFAAFLLATRPEHEGRVNASLRESTRRSWSPRFFATP